MLPAQGARLRQQLPVLLGSFSPGSAFSVLRETPKALGGTAPPGKPRRAADLPACA